MMYLNNMNNATQTELMDIAQTIVAQVNHLDFWARARWGVKQALALGPEIKGVQFNCTRRMKIRIVLEASDTYLVQVGRLKGKFDYVQISEVSDVYADSLVRVIDSALKGVA